MRRYKPWFVGYSSDQRGKSLLSPEEIILLEEHTKTVRLEKTLFKYGIFFNQKWLEAIRSKKPQLIHAHFGYDGLAAIYLKKKLNIPLVVTLHSQDIALTKLRLGYRVFLPRLFRNADLFIVVSQFIRERALAWGCPEDKIQLHFTGIDVEQFAGEAPKYKQPVILFVGRLQNKKGCEFAIRAMKIVNGFYPEAELMIIGDGPLLEPLKQLAGELQVNVNFAGRKNPREVAEIMKRSWVFCGPSITDPDGSAEGLPTVFLEAQASGLPVAGFSSGGVPESVIEGKTALLCRQKDHMQLARNLLFFLDSEEKRKQFGEEGRRFVRERFNLSRQAQELEQIYDRLLRNFKA